MTSDLSSCPGYGPHASPVILRDLRGTFLLPDETSAPPRFPPGILRLLCSAACRWDRVAPESTQEDKRARYATLQRSAPTQASRVSPRSRAKAAVPRKVHLALFESPPP